MILNYVDGEIEGMQRVYLKSHIKRCTSCHRRYRILRQIRDMLGDCFGSFRLPGDLSKKMAERLRLKFITLSVTLCAL